MQREIVGFHEDEHGDWIAELACGHQRHVRHQPPFELLPWAVDAEGRRERVGTLLECGLCEQKSLPAPDAGGAAACLAHLVCPDCGVVIDDSSHLPGCASRA
jgi:hypothetical protein